MAHFSWAGQLWRLVRRPGFWFIFLVLALITIPHYSDAVQHPLFFYSFVANLGLGRHAFERILYLAPIVWSGFLFGWKGALVTSLAALGCMLPRAIFISNYPSDAIFETSAVFIISNALTISFETLRKEREYRTQLERTQQELKTSEERYRELFANAHDAIWLHDLDGNILTVNHAAETLTGYSTGELVTMNVRRFMSPESLNLANQIRQRLLAGEPVEQPYEQRIIRKNGDEVFLQLATSLVFDQGEAIAFQHIARDVTEQIHMQENLRFYLQQATKAQEEERRRISLELHDETIQALVVLSRRLDALASSKEVSAETRQRLEELWQQSNDIMQGVRRLSQDLRPAALDRLGLLSALNWLATDISSYAGITAEVKVTGEERRLPEEVALVLFRITQEALRNVWRHSGANKADISVAFNENNITISVSDNGGGFSPPPKMGDLARDGKLGLAGMQERARLIGATLSVVSEPGVGSTITLEAPV